MHGYTYVRYGEVEKKRSGESRGSRYEELNKQASESAPCHAKYSLNMMGTWTKTLSKADFPHAQRRIYSDVEETVLSVGLPDK